MKKYHEILSLKHLNTVLNDKTMILYHYYMEDLHPIDKTVIYPKQDWEKYRGTLYYLYEDDTEYRNALDYINTF